MDLKDKKLLKTAILNYIQEQQYVHGGYYSHVNNNHQEKEAYLEPS